MLVKVRTVAPGPITEPMVGRDGGAEGLVMHAAASGAAGVRERDPGAKNRKGVFSKGRSESEMGMPGGQNPLRLLHTP